MNIPSYTYYRVLTMVYNTQRYWVFGLCPSSGFEIRTMDKFRKPSISVYHHMFGRNSSVYVLLRMR
jgi:hypothetical protein